MDILKGILMTLSMIAVGVLVWRLLEKQGYGSPPTDDEEQP